MSDPAGRIFPFVQFELARPLGPDRGQYLIRPRAENGNGAAPVDDFGEPMPVPEAEPDGDLLGSADVLVVMQKGAPESKPGFFSGRKAQRLRDGEPPRDVPVTICIVVLATWGMDKGRDASSMMRALKASTDEQEHVVSEGLELLNRAVAAYRATAADPYAIDVSRSEPRAVRIGYGPAQRVVAGRWDDAISVPTPQLERLSREAALQPVEGMSAILAGNSRVLESEEMLLRVSIDIEQGRHRAAASTLAVVVDLLIAELAGEHLEGPVMEQLDTVRDKRPLLRELAAEAIAGPLSEERAEELRAQVEPVGALVDGWRYGAD